MIHGRFGNTSGRPYVEGRLVIPHQNLWRHCPFIIDTGAERSVLMPIDARLMGVNRRRLTEADASDGIGGRCEGYNSLAFLVLFDEEANRLHNFRIKVFIPNEQRDLFRIDSSILGRDVLDRLKLTYDKPHGLVTMEDLRSDEQLDATGWNATGLKIL